MRDDYDDDDVDGFGHDAVDMVMDGVQLHPDTFGSNIKYKRVPPILSPVFDKYCTKYIQQHHREFFVFTTIFVCSFIFYNNSSHPIRIMPQCGYVCYLQFQSFMLRQCQSRQQAMRRPFPLMQVKHGKLNHREQIKHRSNRIRYNYWKNKKKI